MMMTTEELKNKMIDDLKKINYDITKEYEFSNNTDDFEKTNKYVYIYVDNGTYKEVSIDVEYYNSKTINIETENLDDFLFEEYGLIAYKIAEKYAWKYKREGISTERILRIKQLQLMTLINEKYYEREKKFILGLLDEIPDFFDNDGLGDNLDFSLLEE